MKPSEEDPVRRRLRALGAADHVVRGGAEGLVSLWRAFVDEVENGYPAGLDDYRNDLDVRSLIAEAGIDELVRQDDRRLRDLLTASDHRVWESEIADAFWVRGYPRNASGELLRDLRDEGIALDPKK
jgi:hypothetical protein